MPPFGPIKGNITASSRLWGAFETRPWLSSDRLHDLRQHLRPRPQRLFVQEGQWGVGHVQIGYEIGAFGVEVDQTGEELVSVTALLQELKGRAAVGDVVLIKVKSPKRDPGAVVKLHAGGLTGLLLDLDLRQPGYEADFVERFFVLLGPVPALGRAVEVVERDARADDVEERRALVAQRGLEQGHKLLLVAGE